MAASKRLKRDILRELELDIPLDASRSEVRRAAYDSHYVPLSEAEEYAERLADERGLSYV